MRGVEIYRLSGLPIGAINEVGRYAYWTNGTKEWQNTRAYNRLLALVNLKLDEITLLKNVVVADLMNELDLYIVALEALEIAGNSYDNLLRAGTIINAMATADLFRATYTGDNERAKNLDSLIATFKDVYSRGEEYEFALDFESWWLSIIAENENKLTATQKQNFNSFFETHTLKVEGIGATDEKKNFSEYIRNAGDYFLYLFLGDDEIRKYNATIQARYRKEKEIYKYVCNECQGMYDEATVLTLIRNGVILSYKMTPEAKINQLNELGKGKVGAIAEVTAIITAVATVISILVTLFSVIWSCVGQTLEYKYSKPDDEELGIPQADDWGLTNESDNDGIKKFLIFGGVGLAGYYFLSK